MNEQKKKKKMKVTAIIGTGTYYDLWFPYVLVSIYPVCDDIIVVNAGFDLKCPYEKESMVPVEQVSRDISSLDREGKIKEIIEIEDEYDVISVKKALDMGLNHDWREGEYWCDPRGRNYDVANRIAKESGASWTLLMASDTVLYNDAIRMRDDLRSLLLYAYEFAGIVGRAESNKGEVNQLLCQDGKSVQPWRAGDSPALYPSKQLLKFGGYASMPLCHNVYLENTEKYHVAHLHLAVPVDSTEEEWFDRYCSKYVFQYWSKDASFSGGIFRKSKVAAQTRVNHMKDTSSLSDKQTHPPPEVTLLDRKDLAEYVI